MSLEINECGLQKNSYGQIEVSEQSKLSSPACATRIEELLDNENQVKELRDEYKALKKSYTPVNLLMERARSIPIESVWPSRGAGTMQVSKDWLQDVVQQAVDKANSTRRNGP
jgi:hypothetical protein